MREKVKAWEIGGVVFIVVVGTLLHFLFEWTGFWRPIALIAPVNESVWEHFKMAFWPGLVWGVIEYPVFKRKVGNFVVAKTVGLLVMLVVMTTLFYGYIGVVGREFLFVDILTFVVSVAVGQYVSYKICISTKRVQKAHHELATLLLIVLVLSFSLLSFYPLKNYLFQDPNSGGYGVLNE